MGTNYYARTDTCEHCGRGRESLHIGKSMSTMQAISWEGLNSFADWREFLARPDVTVWDEYGEQITDVPAWLNEWTRYDGADDWQRRDRYADTYRQHGDWLDDEGYHMCRQDFS